MSAEPSSFTLCHYSNASELYEQFFCGICAGPWKGSDVTLHRQFIYVLTDLYGPGSSVGIATDYGLDGPG